MGPLGEATLEGEKSEFYSVISLHLRACAQFFPLEIIKSNCLSGAGLASLWMGQMIIYPPNGPALRAAPHTQVMHSALLLEE